jgi:ribosomal protein S18 acetylase RimI-like enzyme
LTPSAPSSIEIVEAMGQEDISEIRRLFRAYADWLNVDLCFQGFDEELAGLPGKYAAPHGRLLLAKVNGEIAGCVAVRPLEDNICEMKRLWVEPRFLGYGLGRKLAEAIVNAGRELGYKTMRLDTMPDRLKAAGHIYDALGFKEIPDYYHNPLDGVVMFELRL